MTWVQARRDPRLGRDAFVEEDGSRTPTSSGLVKRAAERRRAALAAQRESDLRARERALAETHAWMLENGYLRERAS